jgi:trehalose 6-phosphate phosphatase
MEAPMLLKPDRRPGKHRAQSAPASIARGTATSHRNILAPGNRAVLAEIAAANALLAFDYDGTLSPVVSDPKEATMRRATADLLERVANAYPCVIISGRAQEDVLRRVEGTGVFEVIGNHGLEPWAWPNTHVDRVRGWRRSLERRLAVLPGVVIEDKAFSLAVHYRQSPGRNTARLAIVRAAADLDGVRLIGGKCVVNLAPRDAPHKGTALQTVREQFGCDMALYVGDDETDEDVFALDDPGLLSVRVGPRRTSRARYYVRDQRSVDLLLAQLLELREEIWRR